MELPQLQQERHPKHPESAKSHMAVRISTATPDDTVHQVRLRLMDPNKKYETVAYTYVVDKEGRLKGVVSIKELLRSKPDTPLKKIMTRNVTVAHPSTDQERVALIALKQNIKSVPVVDKDRRLLGTVPSDAILNILHWEHTEDLMRMSGIRGHGYKMRNIMKAGALEMARRRFPSIMLGLVGGLLATSIVNYFEVSLEKNLILAFFIPLIVYMNDAVGTQTETLLVRTLATEKFRIGRYIARELLVGLLMGAAVSVMLFLASYVLYRSLSVSFTVSIALFIGVSTATMLAMAVPYTLYLMRRDPAISGGPFTTVLQDIVSLVIYFAIAMLILR